MTGYYKMHRGWMDSQVFAKEPFTEAQAWGWMIEEAFFDASTINIAGKPVVLLRGQFSHSVRFMADKFGWDKSKILRFFDKLKKWEMIETHTETGQNVITICNYSKYQDNRDSNETTIETGARQERDRSETKNNELNKLNKINTHSARENVSRETRSLDAVRENFRKVYDEGSAVFPRLADRNTSSITKWLEAGADPDQDILPEIRRAAGKDVRSWSYFDGAIADAVAARAKPLPEGKGTQYAQRGPDYFERTVEASRRAVKNLEGDDA